MKALLLLSTIGSLTLAATAEDAKLVMVSAAGGLPEGVDFSAKPMNYKFGIKLGFFLEGKDFVRIDEKSLKAEGWTMESFPRVSKDGTQASFSIFKKCRSTFKKCLRVLDRY